MKAHRVLGAIGVVLSVAVVFGLVSLIAYGEFFAKLVGALIIGGIFWTIVLLATLRLTRRS